MKKFTRHVFQSEEIEICMKSS
ncbi:hypothetical protein [Porphyromonas sp. COT-052 OH4946]